MAETTEQYRARINQLNASIKSEPYIEKMRSDIAEGVSKTGNRQADLENDHEAFKSDLGTQFQNVIDVTTDKDFTSAPEIIAARKDKPNLNARLEDFEQSTTAQFQQTESKIENIVNIVFIEDHPLVIPETISGWLSRVINNSSHGVVQAKSKKTYYIKSPIKITANDVSVDFNNSVLASQGQVAYQFEIENAHNVTVKNLFLAKTETDSGGFLKATNVTDLTIKDITGSLNGFENFLTLRGVSRSKFQNINIKNSNATKKGVGIQMDYCVNVDFKTTFLEYFAISVLLGGEKSGGTTGYMNEGINFDGLFCIKQNVGIQCYQCTQLNLSKIILDFCSDYAMYVPNVNGLTINQYWFGLQDGGVTGFELVKGLGIFMKMGTVVGDWTKQATQKAFYSAVDTPMAVDGVYMIDINGGNLDRSKIEVNGDYYYQSNQKPITKSEYGTLVDIFDGRDSKSNIFNKSNMSFSIYSYDQDNKSNFIKSEGYVDYAGVAHINKISFGGTGSSITHNVLNGFNVRLESTHSMTNYKTIINKFVPRPSHNVMEI